MYSHHNKQILLQTCKKGRLLGQTMIIAEIPVCGEAVEKTFVFSRDKRHVMFVTVFSPEHNAFRKMSSMLGQTLFSNSSPATCFHEFPLRAHTHANWNLGECQEGIWSREIRKCCFPCCLLVCSTTQYGFQPWAAQLLLKPLVREILFPTNTMGKPYLQVMISCFAGWIVSMLLSLQHHRPAYFSRRHM